MTVLIRLSRNDKTCVDFKKIFARLQGMSLSEFD